MNCDPHKGRFFSEFSTFAETHNLSFADLILPSDSITYISKADNFVTSWLDHVLISRGVNLQNVEIYEGMTVQDHIPFKFDIILSYDTVSIETGNAEEPTFHYAFYGKKYWKRIITYITQI